MSLEARPYRTTDLQALLDLRLLCGKAWLADPLPNLMELTGYFSSRKNGSDDVVVWEHDGQVVGFAMMIWGVMKVYIHPEQNPKDIWLQSIAWGIDHAKKVDKDHLMMRPRDIDEDLIGVLEENGLVKLDNGHTPRMARDLTQDIPDMPIPDGYEVRNMRGEKELEKWAIMRHLTYGREPTEELVKESMAHHRLEMAYDQYDESLDIVAVAPDGDFVAYCGGALDSVECAATGYWDGWTDPVGTVEGYRNLGLARAVMTEAMRRVKLKGATRALLGTSSDNVAMQALAESLGYKTIHNVMRYRIDI